VFSSSLISDAHERFFMQFLFILYVDRNGFASVSEILHVDHGQLKDNYLGTRRCGEVVTLSELCIWRVFYNVCEYVCFVYVRAFTCVSYCL